MSTSTIRDKLKIPAPPGPDRTLVILSGVVMTAMSGFVAFTGKPVGWIGLAFFGFCLAVAVLQQWRIIPDSGSSNGAADFGYRVTTDESTIRCTSPSGSTKTMRWTEIVRACLATTDEGPFLPDVWLFLFDQEGREMSVPTEARGFEELFGVLGVKLPGFDFAPFVVAGTDFAFWTCWPPPTQTAAASTERADPRDRTPVLENDSD